MLQIYLYLNKALGISPRSLVLPHSRYSIFALHYPTICFSNSTLPQTFSCLLTGISIENQRKLFQEYMQINPGLLQNGGGSGLGLSIAKSIVEKHGGCIGLKSEGEGHGSTFFIEMPIFAVVPPNASDNPMLSPGTSLVNTQIAVIYLLPCGYIDTYFGKHHH